jgi:glycosyltransferase involved in cell wall biosynthesis
VKIVHVGYEHRFDDTRIFLKECKSLKQLGHQVTFITSDKNGATEESVIDGIEVKIINLRGRRIIRQFRYNRELIDLLLKENADLYFIHEIVLVGIGKKLIRKGKRVIYDMHEDSPRQIRTQLSNGKLKMLAPLGEKLVEKWENGLLRRADGVLLVTDIQEPRMHVQKVKNWEMIFNFPILQDAEQTFEKKRQICYAGGISEERGITNLVKLMEVLDCELAIAGEMDGSYRSDLQNYRGFSKVREKGYLSKKQIGELYGESLVGMCTLLNTPNHYYSFPIKLFEYMNAGLPVVCSNFPNMKKVIEGNDCGILVDPENLQEIREAVEKLLNNSELAAKMGERGRVAVREKYNWEREEKKMVNLIERIVAPHDA